MAPKTQIVFTGFLALTPEQQSEFIDEVNKYLKKDDYDRRTLKEYIEKQANTIRLGPLSQGCPCCGRS